jgi:hypothetical protein
MALDILITDQHERILRQIQLDINVYDFIMEKTENDNDFYILKKSVNDYYGESEVYLNELESLMLEVAAFKKSFESSYSNEVNDFISDFSNLINYAITERKTIKFVGD